MKKLIFLFFLFIPSLLFAAIAFDAASSDGLQTAVTSISWNHTCTGSNGILIVGISMRDSSGAHAAVTDITYNGDAMTAGPTATGGYYDVVRTFYLVNPDIGGSYEIAVTFTASTLDAVVGNAVSYTGAKQTGQPDATITASTNGATSLAQTITTVADNCWVVSVIAVRGDVTITPTQTSRVEDETCAATDCTEAGMSDTNGAVTPAGNQTMTWSFSGSKSAGLAIISIAPAEGYIPPADNQISNAQISNAWIGVQ